MGDTEILESLELRAYIVAPDASTDGFLKAIGGLLACFRDIALLGYGFGHIREGDHKYAVQSIWCEYSGIEKGTHNGPYAAWL